MKADNICPHCGKPVPPTALPGLCPECMLKAGLAADTGEVGPDGTVLAKPPAQPAPRVEEIAPHFPQLEILECLGRGGMGAVYKARQPKLDRFVALKILTRHHEGGITDTEFAARFQQEARALARLNHPDIVAVYDFGVVEQASSLSASATGTVAGTLAGGTPAPLHYLLMEYVDGLTLRQLLQTRKLPPEEALAIVPKICAALQFAHERGIVHRDIKPENILLDKQGQVKIADFGIAKIVRTEANGRGLTGAKDVIGTPHYMAPEQIEKPATVDHRADIYSLGVVFYEMLTGELPLGKFQSPSRMVQVDVRLDEVVLHALEKNPDRRYQHASEVKTDVETIASSRSASVSLDPADPQATQGALNEAEWKNPRNWTGPKWLALYFSKRDSRVWVPKQIPALGWTVNLGSRKGAAWLLGILLSIIGIATAALMLVTPPTKTHTPGAASATAAVQAVPPVVIATVPESGAAEVDPALTELRVTFSKPMLDGSWTWTIWGEENFPEKTGEPRYLADGRTCVLPVKLKPGKLYATWINSEYHKDFADPEGQPAMPYLLIFETRK